MIFIFLFRFFCCSCFLKLITFFTEYIFKVLCIHCSFDYSKGPSTFFFLFIFFIGGQLLYNSVLVSAAQQHESAGCIHTAPLFEPIPTPSHPFRWDELSAWAIQQLATILQMVVYICQSYSPNLSHFLSHLPLHPHVQSLCLCLNSCPASRLICKMFLDSICIH